MGLPFPDIDPIALSVGPLEIRWYALAYLAGFLLGWWFCLRLAGQGNTRPNREDIDDFLPYAVAGVILGGRLGYVLFYFPSYYLHNPLEVFMIWQGGMSFHGGLAGVMIAIVGYALWKKIPVLRLGDLIACVAPIGLFFGRIANFINGELFGRITEKPWGFVFPHGGDLPRHPSQLYEAFFEGLVLFALLMGLRRLAFIQDHPGILAGVFLAGYGVFRAGIEFFREPDMQIGYLFGFMTMGQILCIPMILGGLALIVFAMRRHA